MDMGWLACRKNAKNADLRPAGGRPRKKFARNVKNVDRRPVGGKWIWIAKCFWITKGGDCF